jgi:hypothetical protein
MRVLKVVEKLILKSYFVQLDFLFILSWQLRLIQTTIKKVLQSRIIISENLSFMKNAVSIRFH